MDKIRVITMRDLVYPLAKHGSYPMASNLVIAPTTELRGSTSSTGTEAKNNFRPFNRDTGVLLPPSVDE